MTQEEKVKQLSSLIEKQLLPLHVLILSVLLGKEVCFIDNSYGKLSGC